MNCFTAVLRAENFNANSQAWSWVGPVLLNSRSKLQPRKNIYILFSLGQNDNSEILNGQLEWNLTNSRENILLFSQLRYFSSEQPGGSMADTLDASIGIRYQPDNNWSISSQYTRDIDPASGADRQSVLSLQIRYRYFPLNR